MSFDFDGLVSRMTAAGGGLASGVWQDIQVYAIPELKKIAVQIQAIGENIGDYTLAGAKILLQMQVRSAVGVIVAMTSLTLIAVQNAINAILDAVRDFVNAALGIVLIPAPVAQA